MSAVGRFHARRQVDDGIDEKDLHLQSDQSEYLDYYNSEDWSLLRQIRVRKD